MVDETSRQLRHPEVIISVVLCTFNGSARLAGVLASFKQLSVPDNLCWELILIDNRSTDDTAQIIKEFTLSSGLNVRSAFEPQQGKSFALNTAVRMAQGEIVAFTDDDVILHPQWLGALRDTFSQYECAGVAGRVVPLWRQPQPDWLELEDQQAVVHFEYGEEPKELSLPPIGANMAFRRTAFEKYGLFRVDLAMKNEDVSGLEDMEFGSRLLKAGEKIVYAPRAVIYHPVEPRRVSKSYFVRWAYSVGKKQMRSRVWPQDAVRYFGVPRFLFGGLLRDSLRWAVTIDKKRRFQLKLRVYRALGGIREAIRLKQHSGTDSTQIPIL